MLRDLLTELIEIYVRRAGVSQERLEQSLLMRPNCLEQLAVLLDVYVSEEDLDIDFDWQTE